MVIILTGKIASGKSTVAQKLSSKLALQVVRSSNYLKHLLVQDGKAINEKNLQDIGKRLISTIGGYSLTEKVLLFHGVEDNFIYDSLRHIKDLRFFEENFNGKYLLIYLEISKKDQLSRFMNRTNRENSILSFEKRLSHPVEKEAELFKELADVVVANDSLDESIAKIIQVIKDV